MRGVTLPAAGAAPLAQPDLGLWRDLLDERVWDAARRVCAVPSERAGVNLSAASVLVVGEGVEEGREARQDLPRA